MLKVGMTVFLGTLLAIASCSARQTAEQTGPPIEAAESEVPDASDQRRARLVRMARTHVLVVDGERIPREERVATARRLDLSRIDGFTLYGLGNPRGREWVGDEEDAAGALVVVTSGDDERDRRSARSEPDRPATRNRTPFPVRYAPERLRDAPWTLGGEDADGDGRRANFQDGRALWYWLDAATDTLWVRLGVHGEIDEQLPAVSLSFDLDDDQGTGMPWYGSNAAFRFDKMVSVGPVRRDGDHFVGYNGITDVDGVRRRDWINERQGNIAFLLDPAGRSYIVGVAVSDLAPRASRLHFIGSVGHQATWNDDIIDRGHVTITIR